MTTPVSELTALIATASVSGSERAVSIHVMDRLTALGYAPERVGDNVILTVPGVRHDIAVVFNSHMDTVSAGDGAGWTRDPFMARVEGSRVYGLGASDEKAAVAAQIVLAGQYMAAAPPCDVIFMFVVREETDGSGTAETLARYAPLWRERYRAVAGILGEPTRMTGVQIGHRGNQFVTVTTAGDAGHGSNPAAIGVHAVKRMMAVSNTLEELGAAWNTAYADPVLGSPTIGVLTSISAGRSDCPNVFPSSCTATFDVRTVPSMHSSVLQLISQTLGDSARVDPAGPGVPPGYTDPSSPIVAAACGVTGAVPAVAGYSTDLSFFTSHGIPGVIVGPGEPSAMHKPDEYCELEALTACPGTYAKIVTAYTALCSRNSS